MSSSSPVIRRANNTNLATVHQDGTVSFFSIFDQQWRRATAASLLARNAPERDSFSRTEWNRVCRAAGYTGEAR